MKRVLALSIALVCVIFVCSCDGAKKEDAQQYVFRYNGVDISCHADMSEIISRIGQPISYSASPSCAAVGEDKLYTYGGFRIVTCPDGEIDRICRIELRSDLVSTPEGAAVGMSETEVISIYGEGFEKNAPGLSYSSDNCRLRILLRDGTVTGVIYEAV